MKRPEHVARALANSSMADPSPGFREQILREAIAKVDLPGAVALVGILFDYRIILSKRVSNIVQQHATTFTLEPLEPQAAAEMVAGLYDLDPDELFLAFQRDWATTKGSWTQREFLAQIRMHDYVDDVEPCPNHWLARASPGYTAPALAIRAAV